MLMATGSPSQVEFTVNTSFIPGLARGIFSTDPLYNNFLLPSPTGDSCGDGIVLHLLKGTPKLGDRVRHHLHHNSIYKKRTLNLRRFISLAVL